MISLHDFIYCSGVTALAAVGSAAVVTSALVSPLALGLFVASGIAYAVQAIKKG